MIDALHLDRPMICGFSDGGTIATNVAIAAPSSVRALVNDAGFDLLNPNAPSFGIASECGISRGRHPSLATEFMRVYAGAAEAGPAEEPGA